MSILKHVIAIVRERNPAVGDGVRMDHKLIEDLGFDSLDMAELEMTLEDTLGVEIWSDNDDPPKTVGQLVVAATTARLAKEKP